MTEVIKYWSNCTNMSWLEWQQVTSTLFPAMNLGKNTWHICCRSFGQYCVFLASRLPDSPVELNGSKHPNRMSDLISPLNQLCTVWLHVWKCQDSRRWFWVFINACNHWTSMHGISKFRGKLAESWKSNYFHVVAGRKRAAKQINKKQNGQTEE